jgi:hypothetical protein
MSFRNIFSKSEIEFLNAARVGRIATIGPPDGYPHVVPICFAFDGFSFYTTLSKDSKRLRNVERGSKVALLVDKYEEQSGEWLTLQGLLIKCKVCWLNYYKSRGLFMKGWRMLIEKYPQYKQWVNKDLSPRDPDKRIIMQIQPLKKTSWGFTS